MSEQSFERLADQAASGLKGDRELYLDVRQELISHLEEKTERLTREGHTPEESVELAGKSFGSPLDVAKEMLDANKRRMKLRSQIRLAFHAVIIPLAVILALYVGYGRFARLSTMIGGFNSTRHSFRLPTLPGLGIDHHLPLKDSPSVLILSGRPNNEQNARRFLNARKNDPDYHKYYAYYTLGLQELSSEAIDERTYLATMREGERIEPQNALYNLFLAEYYLDRGMLAKLEIVGQRPLTDEIIDRRMFDLGVTELHRAVRKPYLHTYQVDMINKKLRIHKTPVLSEDYVKLMAVAGAELFPHLSHYRNLSRKIPGAARILISEGRRADAEAVIDTWKPLMVLLQDDTNNTLINSMVNHTIGINLTRNSPSIYAQLGVPNKAVETEATYERLMKIRGKRQTGEKYRNTAAFEIQQKHASMMLSILSPVYGAAPPTMDEFTPGRMHEYVIVDEMMTQLLMVILTLALLGTLIQGKIWLRQLKRANAVPLLLMPPVKVLLRALLLGILLPMAAYWIYSHIPVIGGREISLGGGMLPRVIVELSILGLLILWLPSRMIRTYVRRRCADLGVQSPATKDEAVIGWKTRGLIVGALLTASLGFLIDPPSSVAFMYKGAGICFGIAIIGKAFKYIGKKRVAHGLYYGTLARSMAPLYAFAILFISLVIQPWLLYNEAKWLRKDTLIFGYLAQTDKPIASFTSIEEQAAQHYNEMLREALNIRKN